MGVWWVGGGLRRRTGARTGVERAPSGVGRGVIIGGEMTLFAARPLRPFGPVVGSHAILLHPHKGEENLSSRTPRSGDPGRWCRQPQDRPGSGARRCPGQGSGGRAGRRPAPGSALRAVREDGRGGLSRPGSPLRFGRDDKLDLGPGFLRPGILRRNPIEALASITHVSGRLRRQGCRSPGPLRVLRAPFVSFVMNQLSPKSGHDSPRMAKPGSDLLTPAS